MTTKSFIEPDVTGELAPAIPGGFLVSPLSVEPLSSLVTIKNNLVFVPVSIAQRCRLQEIGVNVEVGQASTTIRLGIYSPAPTIDIPKNLLVNPSGNPASSATAGYLGLAFTATVFYPGRYWLAVVSQGGTTQPTLTAGVAERVSLAPPATEVLALTTRCTASAINGLTGPLPSVIGTGTGETPINGVEAGPVPRVLLKVSV